MGSHTSKPVMKYCLKLRCFMGAIKWGRSGHQWQAQEAPQPPAVSDEAEASAAGEDDSPAGADAAAAPVTPLPPLKSVAYQPDPLSWKPGALSCLLNLGAPQAGQSVSGASEIFCRTSLACPQDSHL
jgi:hypothetical protein